MKLLTKLLFTIGTLVISLGSFAPIQTSSTVLNIPFLVQEQKHKLIVSYLIKFFSTFHFCPIKLDETFSMKIFDSYVKMLDPRRDLFLATDLQKFSTKRNELVKELLSGQLNTAYDLYNLAQKRQLMRYQYALNCLNKRILLNTNESFIIDRSQEPWAKTIRQLNKLWKNKVIFDVLCLQLEGKNDQQAKQTLNKRYRVALKRLMFNKSDNVFCTFMNAFTGEIDPHTCYRSPKHARQFNSEINLSLEGIGVVLQLIDDYIVVSSLTREGPAAKSKAVSVNDRIISVGQDITKMVDVVGWQLDDVADLIKGPKGSKVWLEILPPNTVSHKSHKVLLTRDCIRLEAQSVKSFIRRVGRYKLGILSIPMFYIGLSTDVKNQLSLFNKQSIDALVIDLRANGGGALNEAIALVGLFIPGSPTPVVQIRDRLGEIMVKYDHQPGYYSGKLTVLVDSYSASASEIFAATMQDYGRALIVGEETFGKGTVQNLQAINLSNNYREYSLGHTQYTIQKFYRLNGDSTQVKGVVPDINILSTVDPHILKEKSMANALPWDRIKACFYKKVGNFNIYLDKLKKSHQKRIISSSDFAFIQQEMAYKRKLLQRSTVISLNLQQRKQEIKREENYQLHYINQWRSRQGKSLLSSLNNLPNDGCFPDLYLNEALKITSDLLDL